MPESQHPQDAIRVRGFIVDRDGLRRDLYRLLSAVFATGHFHQLCTGHAHDPFNDLLSDFEEFEIERGLIGTAVSMRILLDRAKRDHSFSVADRLCGTLSDDNSEDQPLDLREACNKIVHAQDVKFDVDDPAKPTRLNPTIYLYGSKGGVAWKATLNLIEYSQHIVELSSVAL